MAHQLNLNTTALEELKAKVAALPAAGEDVTAEVTAQSTLMDDLEAAVDALPNAGSSGVETCTISTGNIVGSEFAIILSVCEDGAITSKYITVPDIKNYIVADNAIKGSILVGDMTSSSGMTPLGVIGKQQCFQINTDVTLEYNICFAQDTLILLADGTTKPVQDIAYDDTLLVWDFDNSCYSSARPLWIKQEQTASYYYCCEFDNGTELKLVGSNGRCHRVFSLDRNMFESATECVGERIMTNNGVAKLISCERVDEPVEFYNIITDTHLNLYAEGVLTSCRLNNLYLIKDMKFVKEDREVLPLEAYDGIDENFYRGLRLAEQNPENMDMINGYVTNLYRLKKEV